jgi:hypothetical protein
MSPVQVLRLTSVGVPHPTLQASLCGLRLPSRGGPLSREGVISLHLRREPTAVTLHLPRPLGRGENQPGVRTRPQEVHGGFRRNEA